MLTYIAHFYLYHTFLEYYRNDFENDYRNSNDENVAHHYDFVERSLSHGQIKDPETLF